MSNLILGRFSINAFKTKNLGKLKITLSVTTDHVTFKPPYKIPDEIGR